MVGCPQRNVLVVKRIKPRTFKLNGMIGTIEMLYELESTRQFSGSFSDKGPHSYSQSKTTIVFENDKKSFRKKWNTVSQAFGLIH